MISVQNVSKSFSGVAAVRDVSLDVARGEVVGLLGSNGAGKTTTIRMITGFLPPDSGRITIDGLDTINDSRGARARIGYLAESAPAYAEMAVRDYLDFRARLFGLDRRARHASIERVIDACELGEVRRRRVGHLSKGFRQRVGLAAALVHDPGVLVLDEPANALDPRQIRHTRSLIRELGRERAVLVSSHVLPEVELTCDRVVLMARGRVLADGDPKAMVAARAGSGVYEVEWRGTDARWLQSVSGVERAEPTRTDADGWTRTRVASRPDAGDLREPIASAAKAAGVLVRELRRESVSLERVFMDIVERESSAGGGA